MQSYLVYLVTTGIPVQVSAGEDAAAVLAGFGPEYAAVAVDADVSDATHYVNAQGDATPFPGPGQPWQRFDRIAGDWIDNRTLEQAKAARIELMKAAREAAIAAPLSTVHGTFDADAESRDKIIAAAVGLQFSGAGALSTTNFTLADNSVVTLGPAEMSEVASDLFAATESAHATYRARRASINAAVLNADVDAITWD